jgi:hypothetical protein
MNWTTPELVEVNMSAEVGAYQDDFGDRDEVPIVVGGDEARPSVSPETP